MPTYEYECASCGLRFEERQDITEAPLTHCPECQGVVRRLITGGSGFLLRAGDAHTHGRFSEGCSLERTGMTCCGRDERCDKPPCGGHE